MSFFFCMNLNWMIVLRILWVIYFLFGCIVHITYLSIFPELFDSFRKTTLISRAVDKNLLTFETINPRHFCDDKHRIVDDEIYGWWHGLLMKAPPIIAAIKHWIEKHGLQTSPQPNLTPTPLLAERGHSTIWKWWYLHTLAKKNRKEMTTSEEYLWFLLRNRQIEWLKFRRQHPIKWYIADFYCAEYKLIIEIDWWYHTSIPQQEYDTLRDELLTQNWYTVLRFTNDEINSDIEKVVDTIIISCGHPSPDKDEGSGVRFVEQGWGLEEVNFKIIIPHPSQDVFNQSFAHNWSECSHLLFICGRYEWIDERVRLRLKKNYPDHTQRISLWQFVTLGWELPAMTMTEAVVRLLPGVINTDLSWIEESYSLEQNMQNLEHPQYTRPEVVEGMKVPEVLLSGHHKKIAEWKKDNSLNLPPDSFFNRRGDRDIE